MAPIVHSVDDWLRVNEQFFQPPIYVKSMYSDGQMVAFFVGGPNNREDFHIEEGEEFFYQVKGNMCLTVMEQGKPKDVIIKEGEVFLLPKRIPHSPRRVADTIGFVVERQRNIQEKDCLRYYTENYTEVLYEKWFHLDYLDNQIGATINEYKQSEQYRTGKPIPGTISEHPPFIEDKKKVLDKPFSLATWIQKHREEIENSGKKMVFDDDYEAEVVMYGKGKHSGCNINADTLLWQWAKQSNVSIDGKTYRLNQNHTMLIKAGQIWELELEPTCLTLSITMNPE